jgi:hypothetical protein
MAGRDVPVPAAALIAGAPGLENSGTRECNDVLDRWVNYVATPIVTNGFRNWIGKVGIA